MLGPQWTARVQTGDVFSLGEMLFNKEIQQAEAQSQAQGPRHKQGLFPLEKKHILPGS